MISHFNCRMRRKYKKNPSVLYSSNQGYDLLSRLAGSYDDAPVPKYTTTTRPPPQPVMW